MSLTPDTDLPPAPRIRGLGVTWPGAGSLYYVPLGPGQPHRERWDLLTAALEDSGVEKVRMHVHRGVRICGWVVCICVE